MMNDLHWLRIESQISPCPEGQEPHLTPCVIGHPSVAAKWRVNPSNGLSRVRECDRRQTDRPRYGEMCIDTLNRLQLQQRFRLKTKTKKNRKQRKSLSVHHVDISEISRKGARYVYEGRRDGT